MAKTFAPTNGSRDNFNSLFERLSDCEAYLRLMYNELVHAEYDITYLTDRVATLEANYTAITDAEEEDRAALIRQVDGGAKNLLKIGFTDRTTPEPTVMKTADGTGFVVNGARSSASSSVLIYDIATGQSSGLLTLAEIPAGRYYISGTGNAKLYMQVVAHNGTSQQILIATSGGGMFEYTPDQKADYPYVTFRLATDGNASYDNLTVYPMLCTAADYAISPAFVPYRPSCQEMWEMIQNLQSGGASTQSVQPALMSAAKAETQEQREEETDA